MGEEETADTDTAEDTEPTETPEETSTGAGESEESDYSSLDTSTEAGGTSETPTEKTWAGKFKSPEDLETAYSEAQRLMGQQSTLVNLGRMAAEDPAAFQEWYRSRMQERTAPAEEPTIAWKPPVEYSPALQDIITRGRLDPTSITPTQRAQAEQYLAYTEGKWMEWQQNPYSFAEQIAVPVVMEHVTKAIEQLKHQMWASGFQTTHGDILAEHQAEFYAELKAGVPPQKAIEIIKLRQLAGQNGKRTAELDKREKIAENREEATKKHVKGKAGRTEDLDFTKMAGELSKLSISKRAEALAKYMGHQLK